MNLDGLDAYINREPDYEAPWTCGTCGGTASGRGACTCPSCSVCGSADHEADTCPDVPVCETCSKQIPEREIGTGAPPVQCRACQQQDAAAGDDEAPGESLHELYDRYGLDGDRADGTFGRTGTRG